MTTQQATRKAMSRYGWYRAENCRQETLRHDSFAIVDLFLYRIEDARGVFSDEFVVSVHFKDEDSIEIFRGPIPEDAAHIYEVERQGFHAQKLRKEFAD